MQRIYNFSPGPRYVADERTQQAREEMLNWRGTGMSVMEVSHRGKEFMDVAARSTAIFRDCSIFPRTTRCCFCRVAPRCSSRRFRSTSLDPVTPPIT